jgi:selenocysteine-specific elongation factor
LGVHLPVVMGTAGHIDHGKTTLIKALTGVDCDRLEEEKRRGITIELGFAELRLPGTADGRERSISVIDVPGHERFVHTMVAGASGIDFVLMVIAADEGVMPQTREHLEICTLLGITRGVVAITKVDAVDDDLLELALEDASSFLKGSFLEDAPVIPVSAIQGRGLDGLMSALAELEATYAPVRSQDLFRIPVDRIFTLRGHGTVVTGTMIAGKVKLGDTVQVYPGTGVSKVRGLQNHWGKVEEAQAGRRTAVNLPDLAVADIRRGDVLSHPGTLFPSDRWMAWITCLPSSLRRIRNRAEIHLHHGSRELQAKLYFLDCDSLEPGGGGLCEIRLPEYAVGVFGDRIVLRSFSPLRTVAGGVILNPLGMPTRKREKGFAERCGMMRELADLACSPGQHGAANLERLAAIQLICTTEAFKGISFDNLRILANLDSRSLEKVLSGLLGRKEILCYDKTQKVYVADFFVSPLAGSCKEILGDYHKKYPEQQGMNRNELLSGWGKNLPVKLACYIVEQLVKKGEIEVQGEYVRLSRHKAGVSQDQAALAQALLQAYREAGWAPPAASALFASLSVSPRQAMPLLAFMRQEGKLIRISDEFWYTPEHLNAIEAAMREWFKEKDILDVAGMKSITGLARKHMIPLFEYFDARKITMRKGDVRVLIDKRQFSRDI